MVFRDWEVYVLDERIATDSDPHFAPRLFHNIVHGPRHSQNNKYDNKQTGRCSTHGML